MLAKVFLKKETKTQEEQQASFINNESNALETVFLGGNCYTDPQIKSSAKSFILWEKCVWKLDIEVWMN